MVIMLFWCYINGFGPICVIGFTIGFIMGFIIGFILLDCIKGLEVKDIVMGLIEF